MCGICGIVSYDRGRPVSTALVRSMTEMMRQRGPDGHGEWISAGVGLGSRRLAILDLTDAGSQPMANEDGTVQVVFNGAIYNHRDLRRQLESRGHLFRSHTDTETIVHLWEEQGERCVDALHGMFAFAVWDAGRDLLFLARDRLGEKPLFYADTGTSFAFASDLKALLLHPDVPRDIDLDALHLYLAYQSVPAPYSAFRAIRKLPSAHSLVVTREGPRRPRRYWRLSYRHKQPMAAARAGEIREELVQRIDHAVRERLMSDVTIGALLSGGVDSSMTVALMARASAAPVKTFSVGFEPSEYDERAYARQVARRYAADHHELLVTPDASAIFPSLVRNYGEPFADSSAIPTYYVYQAVQSQATVVLTGDGGDETFGGYLRYQRLAGRAASVAAMRWLAAAATNRPTSVGPAWRRLQAIGGPQLAYYYRLITFDPWRQHQLLTPECAARLNDFRPIDWLIDKFTGADADDPAERAMAVDVDFYLPDTLMAKTDVSSMAHSVEARAPFLDHTLMEFVASLPIGMKIEGGVAKHLLKQIAAPLVPASVINRPKMGFVVPIDHWLRHELKACAYDTLLSRRARDRGYFRPAYVQSLIDRHQQGLNMQQPIWFLLMFEWWHQQFVEGGRGSAQC